MIQTLLYNSNRNFGLTELPRALGKLGDKRAIEPLREIIKAPNPQLQQDLRGTILEALVMLQAPNAFDDATAELKKLTAANRLFEIGPILVALGHSREAKAIPLIEPHLANGQTCQTAADALLQIGTKDALEALETRLTAPGFQFGQIILQAQRPWPHTPAVVAMLRRLAASGNQFTRNAAAGILDSVLQRPVLSGPAAPVGYYAPLIEADAWVNGPAPTAAELAGKVVVVYLPAPGAEPPASLPAEAGTWQKYEKQGLVVLALMNAAGWDWDATAKSLVSRPGATLKQQQEAAAAWAKARGIKHRIGLAAPAQGVVVRFGGPAVPRFAFIDRAGILQAVRPLEDFETGQHDLEALLRELLAEPAPSAAALKGAQQAALQRKSQRDLKIPPASLDPSAPCWTIPAHNSTIWSVKFSPDGKWMATTDEDGTAKLWDAATGVLRRTLHGHTGVVRNCAFTHDGKQFLTGGFDRTIRVWDAASGEPLQTLTDDSPVYFLSLLGDDRTIISSSGDSRVRYWNLTQGALEGYLLGHTGPAWASAAATVNGNSTIITGSVDKSARLWQFQTGEIRHTLSGHVLGVSCVALASDAKTAASGAADGEVIIWDAATGQADQTISGNGVLAYEVAFSPDNRTLAVARRNHTVTLYDVATGKPTRQFNRGGWCVAFAPDGKLLASGSDDRVLHVWKLAR